MIVDCLVCGRCVVGVGLQGYVGRFLFSTTCAFIRCADEW